MADPRDAYNREQSRRSLPLTRGQELSRGIGVALDAANDVLMPGGMNPYIYYPMNLAIKAGESVSDYLKSPSSVLEDFRSGKRPESEIPLGTDLVDIFGETEDVMGAPDFVPDDYEAGEIFKFDPTGEGKSKPIPDLLDFSTGPKDRGALGRQVRARKAATQAEVDDAITSKMDADSMYVTPEAKEDKAEQMFTAAMQDFIQEARGTGPDVKGPRSLEEYKKEFAEATGIDISGKPDKSQALMAFGLALMQNKAGKGFNISKMLGEVGVAGEAAMPELEKAKERARQDGIAAGKYALEMRSAD